VKKTALSVEDVAPKLQGVLRGSVLVYTHLGNSFLRLWGFENERPDQASGPVSSHVLLVGVRALGRRTGI
jgi:hypothetical protein